MGGALVDHLADDGIAPLRDVPPVERDHADEALMLVPNAQLRRENTSAFAVCARPGFQPGAADAFALSSALSLTAIRTFSKRIGMSGRRASRISLTCSSTLLNGSTCTFASSIAFSIRWGGWGAPVCGLIAFAAMYCTICLRFASNICRRCSVVS